MSDHDQSPIQGQIMRPHVKAGDPHKQYVLRADLAGLVADLPSAGGGGDATGLSDATPAAETIAATGTPGVATNASRSDHRHAMPGLVTATLDGFMPVADHVAIANRLRSPPEGGLLDIDKGELVFDIDNQTQVYAG